MDKPIAYIGDLPYIFVSYSHRNTDLVWDTLGDLQKDGFRFWYDDGIDPGVSWDDYIADHINNCGYFIAFVSAEYAESNNCIQELRYALGSNKTVLVVRLDENKLTSGLEMRLCSFQAINYYELDGTEYLERIESADGIEAFRPTQIKQADRYSYKEKYPRLMRVLKQSYYCEALFLEHELIDNILFWCLFNMGIVANTTSSRIREKIRPELVGIVSSVNGCECSTLSIGSVENKLNLVRQLYQWANTGDFEIKEAGFIELKDQLQTPNYNDYENLFLGVDKWLLDLKAATSKMLKNNADMTSDANAELASRGKMYAGILNDKVYKEIRKGNRVRKGFGLAKK